MTISRLEPIGVTRSLLNHPSAAPFVALDMEKTLILCPSNGAEAIANIKEVWVRIPRLIALQPQRVLQRHRHREASAGASSPAVSEEASRRRWTWRSKGV